MSAAPTRTLVVDDGLLSPQEAIATTLLDLVRAISEVTDDDHEIVATVQHLLDSGRVRLTGNFRDFPSELLR